jgi:cell volume regulation protein A
MFLVLGLLSVPRNLVAVGWTGVGIGLTVTLVARPLSTFLCLLPFRYPFREALYVGWVGLRGAVPIILATYPVLARVEGAQAIFNLVFFIVVVNAIVPGTTVRWVTRALGLESKAPPPPKAVLEIISTQHLKGDLLSFYIDSKSAAAGARLADLDFPDGTAALLIIRGEELIAPRGTTEIIPGDHVYVFCQPGDRPFLHLLFGQAEED